MCKDKFEHPSFRDRAWNSVFHKQERENPADISVCQDLGFQLFSLPCIPFSLSQPHKEGTGLDGIHVQRAIGESVVPT